MQLERGIRPELWFSGLVALGDSFLKCLVCLLELLVADGVRGTIFAILQLRVFAAAKLMLKERIDGALDGGVSEKRRTGAHVRLVVDRIGLTRANRQFLVLLVPLPKVAHLLLRVLLL